jgi:hypothetical protein
MRAALYAQVSTGEQTCENQLLELNRSSGLTISGLTGCPLSTVCLMTCLNVSGCSAVRTSLPAGDRGGDRRVLVHYVSHFRRETRPAGRVAIGRKRLERQGDRALATDGRRRSSRRVARTSLSIVAMSATR